MVYRQEQIKPYNESEEKGTQVERMFDNIAHSYDELNHHLSWNIDRMWRKRALKKIAAYKPQTILDIATGTGDFAISAAEMIRPQKIVGADISSNMLEIGKEKARRKHLDKTISFCKEDCMHLSFGDGTFDAVTAAFGIRNFSDLDKGLREMHRILRQGGHLCIVEITSPVTFPMKQLFKVYSHTFLPFYGKLLSGDKAAYQYLTATIEAFPQGEKMVGILKKAGFSEAEFTRYTLGICTMYFATK